MKPPHIEEFTAKARFDRESGKFFRIGDSTEIVPREKGSQFTVKVGKKVWPARKLAYWFHHGEYNPGNLKVRDGNPLNLTLGNIVTSIELTQERRTRACPVCGTRFTATNATQRCCSRTCAKRFSMKSLRISCLECGGPIPAGHLRCRPCKRTCNRQRAWARKFGLGVDDMQAMLAAQGYGCAICGAAPDEGPVVDHDHGTGAVRGLLCRPCNSGIGLLGDNAGRVRAAGAYLEKHAPPQPTPPKKDA